MKPKIALQLWSIQEDCQKDFAHALKSVKESGYNGVEFAGYANHSAEEVEELLEKNQLEVAASHIPYESLFDHFDETIQFEQIIGNKRIVVPYATFETFEEWKTFIHQLSEVAEKVKAAGMSLYYHNHSHEFSEIEGYDIIDYLLKHTENVQLELDLYWLAHADKNVEDWIETHKDRIGLFHMKDMQEAPQESTELGSGVLPLESYVQKAKDLELSWLIVEQEAFQTFTPLEAAKINAKELSSIVRKVY